MPVKIFEGSGADGIRAMELKINDWLGRLTPMNAVTRIKEMQTAATSVKDAGQDEIYQHLIVTFLYEGAPLN